MPASSPLRLDPKLDLVLERVVDVKPELIWKAWTTPASYPEWFCPKPWSATCSELDLRPGGAFRTEMRGPAGEHVVNEGCVLEAVPNERLVWTAALKQGFRPQQGDTGHNLPFTAYVLLEPHGAGTRYTALGVHATEEGAATHAKMGFKEGWGAVLDQLVAYVKRG